MFRTAGGFVKRFPTNESYKIVKAVEIGSDHAEVGRDPLEHVVAITRWVGGVV